MPSDLSSDLALLTLRTARFLAVWGDLADDGLVDSLGGAEYMRVSTLWVQAGCPPDVRRFIRYTANASSSGPLDSKGSTVAGDDDI